jgi:hypothetical protein
MRNSLIYSVLLISFLLIGCNSNDNHVSDESNESDSDNTEQHEITEGTLYIDHYRSRCTAGGNGFCMRTRRNSDSKWETTIYSISDFDFEWGYRYKVRIEEVVITCPDYSCMTHREYTLLELLDKEAVGPDYLFDLHVLTGRNDITKREDGSYYYSRHDSKDFVCSPEICSALDSLIEQGLGIRLEMRYQESPEDPMVLTQIKCSALFENYNDDCRQGE